MEPIPRQLEVYATEEGKQPFEEWMQGIRDKNVRAAIRLRLERVEDGNFGDHRSVGSGVSELRVNLGPGFRIYYGLDGKVVVLLLCGGDKSTQVKDIKSAIRFWQDYQKRG